MKLPLSWLRDYVDLTLPVAKLVDRLTLAGLEVGGVRLVGLPPPEGLHVKSEDAGPVWDRDKIVVAQIVETNKHPDADRLKLVTVAYGAAEPKVIVTGAGNINVGDKGQKVILALTGSTLYDGHAEGKVLKTLKPTKIRGVPSDAMVCSAFELGIHEDHEGIIILEPDAPVGMPLAEFMGDIVIEVDVLPNMARCLSMIGVAREIAALTGQSLRLPPHQMQSSGETINAKVNIEIEDSKLCARYVAALIRNVQRGPSPRWMQYRLTLAGMRPIDNIVDTTNYVMLEWGQPLHAFDYDKLVERATGQTPTIIVRNARLGESLKTLDGQVRKLSSDNLLIADTAGPIALAGVMGGAETEVTPATKHILLESANFNFVSIRRTARQFDLPSEASYRFSRAVHPEMVRPAAERAADLMREHAAGSIANGLAEQYPAPVPRQQVTLPVRNIQRLLGFDFPVDEAERILQALEFQVEHIGVGTDHERLIVTTPPHRLDIQHGPADLIEELARVYGYDRLPATMLREELPEQHTKRALVIEDQVRDLLVNAGLQEVITYSLTTPEREAAFVGKDAAYVRLANPISSERVVMRRSVLSGVLEIMASNLRQTDRVQLFEIGSHYVPKEGQNLPEEPLRLAVAVTGPRTTESWASSEKAPAVDFFDLKGILAELLAGLHVPDLEYRPVDRSYLHPGKAAEVFTKNQSLGVFGQLHPTVAQSYGLGNRAVFIADFDLGTLLTAAPERYRFAPVPEFPPVRQDIAIVVDDALPAAKVAAEIRAGGGAMLRDVRLFDVYRGTNIPTGKKSLAYALTYQADDKTLTDKEVAKVHGKIVSRLEKVLNAQLRA